MGYTCGYYEREDMTLDESQNAKFDLALGKLGLEPGMTLLDIGCGWGGALERAVEKFDVNVIGITLSKAQSEWARERLAKLDTNGPSRSGCRAGRSSTSPSTASCRSAPSRRSRPSATRCSSSGPTTSCPRAAPCCCTPSWRTPRSSSATNGIKVTLSDLKFMKFIGEEIFPGGQLPAVEDIQKLAADTGFDLQRIHLLRPHYARTLDMWAANLEAAKDEAIAMQGRKSTTGT